MKYSEKQPLVTVSKVKNAYHYSINHTQEQVGEEFEVESVTIVISHKLGADDYGTIVSAIVRSRYSVDDVEAIQLNYMESNTTEHKNEFASLRDWRAFAKDKAKEAIEYVANLARE